MTYSYTHKLIQLSFLIGEVFIRNIWQLTQSSTTDQGAEATILLSLKWKSRTVPFWASEIIVGREDRKIVNAETAYDGKEAVS